MQRTPRLLLLAALAKCGQRQTQAAEFLCRFQQHSIASCTDQLGCGVPPLTTRLREARPCSSRQRGAGFSSRDCWAPPQRQLATRPQRTTRAQRSEGTPVADASRPTDAKGGQTAGAGPSQAEAEEAEASRLTWQVDEPFGRLDDSHVNMFWDFGSQQQQLVPEAFQAYYTEALKRGETVFDRGGCKGLQAELNDVGDGRLLVRQQMLQLRSAIEAGHKKQHFVDGPMGGGKSVTLAALASWGRLSGRIVVYLPSASILTAGGFYHKDEATGMWHTPDSARLLMNTVQAQHRDQLSHLAAPAGEGTLDDVITEGIKSSDDNAATEAAVQLLEGLKLQSEVEVLFVVDDWNSLYWPTGYFEWQSVHKQYNVLPIELRLCMVVRSLIEEAPPVKGSVVVATTRSKGISTRIIMPRPRVPGRSRSKRYGTAHFEIPTFDLGETFAWLGHLAANAVVPREPRDSIMEEWNLAWHLTGGNPAEMRRHLTPLFHSEGGDASL